MDLQPGSGPARRAGDRGHYGRLTRERVLTSALELVDRDGLPALSMRKVGAELGVEGMALYRYANGKDALLDGLVEMLYAELRDRLAAADQGTDARAELHRIALATYQVSLAHPHAVPLLATRMLELPLARRQPVILQNYETILGLLTAAGLDDRQAAEAYRAITAWTLGYILTDLQAVVDNPDEPDPAFRMGLHHMPAQEFPRLRATAPAIGESGGAEGLAVGLDALLDRLLPATPPFDPGSRGGRDDRVG